MNYDCEKCKIIIIGQMQCPICRQYSTRRSSVTLAIEDLSTNADLRPVRAVDAKRKRQDGLAELIAQTGMTAPASPLAKKLIVSDTNYALLITLGRSHADQHGGDGAYAKWMLSYFGQHVSTDGCVLIEQLTYPNDKPVGTATDGSAAAQLSREMKKEFERVLAIPAMESTRTIILNWHVRFTGTPNGYTGRGLAPALLKALSAMATKKGKNLLVVYTVHESKSIPNKLITAKGMVALNREVHSVVEQAYPDVRKVKSSVPGLMTCLHTNQVGQITSYLFSLDSEAPASTVAENLEDSQVGLQIIEERKGEALGVAYLLQKYRAASDNLPSTLRGILIFGMIDERHGTTVENVRALCEALDSNGNLAGINVVVAGKPEKKNLVEDLVTSGLPRLKVVKLIGSFSEVAGCKYAISFDSLGFRTNASAMINVIRAGHLLFSRHPTENSNALIGRAIRTIHACEGHPGLYLDLLAQQHPRYRSSEPAVVGVKLANFFRELVQSHPQVSTTASAAETTTPLGAAASSPSMGGS